MVPGLRRVPLTLQDPGQVQVGRGHQNQLMTLRESPKPVQGFLVHSLGPKKLRQKETVEGAGEEGRDRHKFQADLGSGILQQTCGFHRVTPDEGHAGSNALGPGEIDGPQFPGMALSAQLSCVRESFFEVSLPHIREGEKVQPQGDVESVVSKEDEIGAGGHLVRLPCQKTLSKVVQLLR